MGQNKSEKRIRKRLGAVLAAVILAGLSVQTAFGASSYINSVSITVDADVIPGESLPSLNTGYANDEGYEVMVPNNDRYEAVSAKWSSDPDEAKLGGTYTMKITLKAINDYKFSGSYSSSKVKVKGADFVNAERSGSGRLVVTVKSKQAKGDLDAPEEAYWDSTIYGSSKFGYAKWDSVEYAAYEVSLYRGSKSVHKETNLHGTSFDFYPYMTAKGTYTFRVRSVPSGDDISKFASRSDWMISDELYVDANQVSDGSGQGSGSNVYPSIPQTSQVGWIEDGGHTFFRYPDGEYVRNNWAYIGEAWYLFDSSGAMLTGWQMKDNVYYFLNSDGKMLTGWYQENGTWYYLRDSGAMATGWLQLGDKTYYLTESGAMAVGWTEIDGQTYYFYPDGHKAVNEKVDGLFYVDMNGVWRR